MITQAKTTKTLEDKNPFPKVQVTYLTRVDDATQLYPYGTHGSPPVGSPCVMVSIEGDEANKYVIPVSASARPKSLKENEFITGNFVVGSTIKFDKDGNIDLTCTKNLNANVAGTCNAIIKGNTNITTPLLTLNGNFFLNGSMTFGEIVEGGTPEIDGTFDLKSTSVMNAKGTMNNTGSISGSGTITEGSINLKDHLHGGVDTGISNTGSAI